MPDNFTRKYVDIEGLKKDDTLDSKKAMVFLPMIVKLLVALALMWVIYSLISTSYGHFFDRFTSILK